jgi:hypothetical protein
MRIESLLNAAVGSHPAGVPGLEPRLTEPESVGLPITPYPMALHGPRAGLGPASRIAAAWHVLQTSWSTRRHDRERRPAQDPRRERGARAPTTRRQSTRRITERADARNIASLTSRPDRQLTSLASCGTACHDTGKVHDHGRSHGSSADRRSTSVSLSAAASTAGACIRPGCLVRRSMGPDTDTAATTLPVCDRTGADTDATPGSRSPTDCAQPRRRTTASIDALKRAPWSPRCMRSGSSHASNTWAAEPASIVRVDPTGIVSRRPLGRSEAATQIRRSPCRRNSWALSPVASRNAERIGPAAASSRSSPADVASSPRRGPRTKRPCMSRATSRWCSRATASRCAVGRANPVAWTRLARVAGPASSAESTSAALSRTPTPLELSMY